MKEKIIAKIYAEAFVSYVKESRINLEKVVVELNELKTILSQNPDFYEFLENAKISYTEKYNTIDKVFESFSSQTKDFLKLLLDKERIKSIVAICDYIKINYSHEGIRDALLKTSYPLDLVLIRKIKEKLEIKFKKRLDLHVELDRTLLGGIQVTVGNTIIDGSIKKGLDDLKEKLMTVRVP